MPSPRNYVIIRISPPRISKTSQNITFNTCPSVFFDSLGDTDRKGIRFCGRETR